MTSKFLIVKERYEGDDIYDVSAYNGIHIGCIYQEVDGYYVFWPNKETQGYWDEMLLHSLADQLKAMNASWDAEVQRGLL